MRVSNIGHWGRISRRVCGSAFKRPISRIVKYYRRTGRNPSRNPFSLTLFNESPHLREVAIISFSGSELSWQVIPRSIRLGVSLSLQASKMGAISSKSVTSIVKHLKRDTLLRIAFETWAWMSLSCIQTELKVTLNRAGADLSKNTRGSCGSMGIYMNVGP